MWQCRNDQQFCAMNIDINGMQTIVHRLCTLNEFLVPVHFETTQMHSDWVILTSEQSYFEHHVSAEPKSGEKA